MKKIYFIGIGGSGMSGLAEYAYESGLEVAGSDTGKSTTITKLKDLGLEIVDSHDTSLLKNYDIVVYSSAISSNNLELQLAKDLNKIILHRSEFLARLCRNKKCIAVAGSHGKTTTSAMITHILVDQNLDPSAVIGGRMRFNHSNHYFGKGDLFVIEADESDGSFLNYSPLISVVTNIGLDHLDHHNNLDGLKASFKKFIGKNSPDGGVVLGWDDLSCREVAEDSALKIMSFGKKLGCDLRILKLQTSHGQVFLDVMFERDRFEFEIPIIGAHNALNALAALAVCRLLDLDIKKCISSLKSFAGVDRRLNYIHQSAEIIILDDYAHNPDKIQACIKAVRDNWPERQLHVAFQPHRYSRLMTTWQETSRSFNDADHVYIFPVYAAGECSPEGFSIDSLVKDIKTVSQKNIIKVETFDNIVEIYDNNRSANDVFLTIGAGDIFKAANKIGEHFGKKEKQ